MTDLPIRCSCGSVRGVARGMSPSSGNRLVCYCDDCQAYAHFLEGEGGARSLDAHGGTDVFQMAPSRLEITQGKERLACVRLTERGLLRWFAGCCKTPIGNTIASAQLPFVGLIHACVDHAADGRTRDEALGPVRMRVHGRFATGDRASLDAHDRAPLSMLLPFATRLLVARLRGEHKPSPFFDATTGVPNATPRVLSA